MIFPPFPRFPTSRPLRETAEMGEPPSLAAGDDPMNSIEFDDWPFPILRPEAEWSEFDRDFVAFMRAAYARGLPPAASKEWRCD